MERAAGYDRAIERGKRAEYAILFSRIRSIPAAVTLFLVVTLVSEGCATGPQVKTIVRDTFSIEAIEGTSRQTVGNVTVEDLGEAQGILTPVEVQACDGPFLVTRKLKRITKEGEEYTEEHPVLEIVDPFQGVYVRRLKIRNDTEHTMRLNRIDAVLLDAAGNDNELMTKSMLGQDLLARRPCPSTRGLIENLRSVKLLGADIRIRPGREAVLFAAFSGVDRRIVGDWTLELNEMSVSTNSAGEVSRVASFEFPLLVKGYRTVITLEKNGLFEPWVEVHRRTDEVQLGP